MPGRIGVTARLDDGRFFLDLAPTPEMLHHGIVRASVLSYVVDAVAGIDVDESADVWTLTTDLSLRMRAVPAPDLVIAGTETVRKGRTSVTCIVELTSGDGLPIGTGAVGFAYVPRKDTDPPKRLIRPADAVDFFRARGALSRPLRDEAGIERVDAGQGMVQVELTPALMNPAGTLQGAMVALVAEAAAEDLVAARTGSSAVVTDLDLRYLARTGRGPVRASTRALTEDPDGPVEVKLVDLSTGVLTTLAYARAVPVRASAG